MFMSSRTATKITPTAAVTTCFDANPQTSPEALTAEELTEIFNMAQIAAKETVTEEQQLALERLGAHLDMITPKGDVFLSIAQGRYSDKRRDEKSRLFDHSGEPSWLERLERRFTYRSSQEQSPRLRRVTGL